MGSIFSIIIFPILFDSRLMSSNSFWLYLSIPMDDCGTISNLLNYSPFSVGLAIKN